MARKPGKLAAAAGFDASSDVNDVQSSELPNLTTDKGSKTKNYKRGRGSKHIGGYFSEETLKQLKVLGAMEGKTQQELIQEALNSLFEKYGKPPIA